MFITNLKKIVFYIKFRLEKKTTYTNNFYSKSDPFFFSTAYFSETKEVYVVFFESKYDIENNFFWICYKQKYK